MVMNLEKHFVFFITIILTIIVITYNKVAYSNFRQLINNNNWIMNLGIIILFTVYIMYKDPDSDIENKEEIEHQQDAVKKAILAFIIAFFDSLDLIIGPFWVVFVISYYLNGFT